MTAVSCPAALPELETRARASRGASSSPIYEMVARGLRERHPAGGALLDLGCGTGSLWSYLADRFDRYLAADAVRYEGLPKHAEFFQIDLDARHWPISDAVADVVAAVETIEHLQNPRAFVRELVRVARPGGWVVVTTPNQLSLLSKLTLVVKNQFNAFQDASYPAHLTALLEIDLRRIAAECGLTDVAIAYSGRGRLPGTGRHFPRWCSALLPRLFSDNVMLRARKPQS